MASAIGYGILYTILMTLISTLIAYLIGLPLGIILQTSAKNGLSPNRPLNSILGMFINVLRSIPCLFFIILLMPVNRAIFNRATGAWYVMILPLVVSSFAFIARMVETSLNEVDNELVETFKSMGASRFQIVTKVLIREAIPSLISGLAISIVSILGYTAFAYAFGGEGLLELTYSIYKGNPGQFYKDPNFYLVLMLIVVLVQIFQESGLKLAKVFDKRRKH